MAANGGSIRIVRLVEQVHGSAYKFARNQMKTTQKVNHIMSKYFRMPSSERIQRLLENDQRMKANPQPERLPDETLKQMLERTCAGQPAGVPVGFEGDAELELIMPSIYRGMKSNAVRLTSKKDRRKSADMMAKLVFQYRDNLRKQSGIEISKDLPYPDCEVGMIFHKNGQIQRNTWFSKRYNNMVSIYQDINTGKCKLVVHNSQNEPYNSSYKAMMYLATYRAASAYSLEAEEKALNLLKSIVTQEQYQKYVITGMLHEKSSKSGLLYIFRRQRPTIVLRKVETTDYLKHRFVAALCLHPQGYYQCSWAGTLVPTDDVVTHLMMMRGDEKYLWRKSSQHTLREVQADF